MLWIFLWDDEIDDAGTVVSQSESHASTYCQNSLQFAHRTLGLDGVDTKGSFESIHDLQTLPCPIPTMVYFKEASEALRTELSLSKERYIFVHMMTRLTQVRPTGKIVQRTLLIHGMDSEGAGCA